MIYSCDCCCIQPLNERDCAEFLLDREESTILSTFISNGLANENAFQSESGIAKSTSTKLESKATCFANEVSIPCISSYICRSY